ncbi:MAG: alkylated DNA repair protein [Salinarimonadaceae bacterium]|nr:MAG: alkylated DNA repair protein [Salinarimonadaceae bacterium]
MNRAAKRAVISFAALAAAGAGAFWAFTSPSLSRVEIATVAGAPDLANGELLFNAGGCASCHAAPGGDDRTNLAGGLALATGFGTFHAPNISPHREDGIGAWSVGDFVLAMRAGVSPDGRHYYPAFPYTSYQRMREDDLRDMFGYIMSLEPVAGRAPDHDLAFPYNIRRGVGLWKLVYLDGARFEPDPSRSESWNRGAYLVEAAAHCAECHSTRDFAGAIVPETRFAGGPEPDGQGFSPNITPHPDGVAGWSEAEMADLLATGFTPDFDSVGGSMAAVIRNTALLPQADIEAMAEYILSLPPRPTPPRD